MTSQRPHADTTRQPDETRILVVVDEPALALCIVGGLEERGHRAVWSVALSAVACVLVEQPHLILLDMDLPDGGAAEILAVLKADARTAMIPVLALG